MFGIEPMAMLVIAVAAGIGGFAKGVTGIGLPIIAIAITVNYFEPRTALAIIVVPIVVTNLWQSLRSDDLLAPLRRFWLMIVCFLITLLTFARVMAGLDTQMMFGVLGIVVTLFALSSLWRPRAQPLSPKTERWLGPVDGILGGILGGLTTIWGPPMMMFFVLLKLDKDEWVRTVGFVWSTGAIPLAYAYWQNGVLNEETLPLSLYACIPGLIGIVIGEMVRKHINQEAFRKTMLIVLFVIGLNLIRRAVF